MRIKNILLGALFILFISSCVFAEPWAKTVSFESIQKIGKIIIPNGESTTSKELTFPAVDNKADTRIVLRFQAKNDNSTPGGWNYFLGLNLNSAQLSEYTQSGTQRLINRDTEIKVDEGRIYGMPYWGNVRGMPLGMLVFFGPGGDKIDKRIQTDRDELYWYAVDITDLMNFKKLALDDLLAENKTNVLTISNYTLFSFLGGESRQIVLDDIEVGYLSVKDWQPKVSRNATQLIKVEKPSATLNGKDFKLIIGPGGSIHIEKNSESYILESTFSYPSDKIGFNALSEAPGKDQFAGWKPVIRSEGNKKATISAKCGSYKFVRTVSIDGTKVHISDDYKNITFEPIGIIVRNSASSPGTFTTLFGGVPDTIVSSRTENPTVFLECEKTRLGVLVEDNVMRLQLSMLSQPSRAIWKTENFGLDSGKSYTMKWTVYTYDKTADYWTFINNVRKDWKINYTINGPWTFFNVQRNAKLLNDPVALKAYLKRKNIKIAALAPWLDYDNLNEVTGKMLTRDDYKAIMQKAAKALRDADPNIWVTGCIESFPRAVSLEASKMLYDRLPKSDQKDGYPPVSTDIFMGIDEVTPNMIDGMTQGPDGKYAIEVWRRGTLTSEGTRDMNVIIRMAALISYPAPGNAQANHLMDEARYLIKECGLDGLYIDCFTLAYDGYLAHMRYDYKKWDGNTVDIDANTGKIVRKYTDAGLVGGKARAELIKYVLKNGKTFQANGYPVCMEEQNLGAFHFSESEYHFEPMEMVRGQKPPLFYRMCASHLSCPMGLGYRVIRIPNGEEHYAEIIMKTVIAYLRHGALTCHYVTEIPETGPGAGEYGAFNNMYPITPVELHEGWILGKERIITAISGNYIWSHPNKPEVLIFNITGRPTQGKVDIEKIKDGWSVKLGIADWDNVAIIK